MFSLDHSEYRVSGTITTGVRVYHVPCDDWFVEWSSRDPYPTLAEFIQACEQHECPKP